MSIKKAIISVSNKKGIVDFARRLHKMGVEIISTGGTARTLTEAGINVIGISEVTGFPECLDGRVKTLHPGIHGGLLAVRDNQTHMDTLKKLGINPIDLVVVNLYPFKETVLKPSVTLEEAIENIDIGGPTMLRAAAKNHKFVTVVVDPEDYDTVLSEFEAAGDVSEDTRFKLAAKVFSHTAHYDALINQYLCDTAGLSDYPETLTLTYEKRQGLRYGENPHQKAAYYVDVLRKPGGIADAVQLHGKELSFNNINDASAALNALKEFEQPAAVAVKHANPCGVALGEDIYDAYIKAYNSDPVSIFGGIVALNREVDERTAEELRKIFLEIVIAPSYSKGALEILTSKKDLRLLKIEAISEISEEKDLKKVGGGLLMQDADITDFCPDDLKQVTKASPSPEQMRDLLFAWKVVKHVKSNAIVVAKDGTTLGIGPGQVNRIWAAQQCIERSGIEVKGAVMASDAFFPFDDVAKAAATAGITAIIQPGGSIHDKDSIALCDENNISMVFTGLRHFRH